MKSTADGINWLQNYLRQGRGGTQKNERMRKENLKNHKWRRDKMGEHLPSGQLWNEEEHAPLLRIFSSATLQHVVVTMMIFSAVLFPWNCVVFLRTCPNSLGFFLFMMLLALMGACLIRCKCCTLIGCWILGSHIG